MRYKAIISDIDGTLILNKKNGEISQKTAAAISKIKQKVHFGFATSRPAKNVIEQFGILKLSGPSIVYGGAQIIDLTTHKILWQQLLELDDATYVFQQAKKLGITFYSNDSQETIKIYNEYTPQEPISFWGHGLDFSLLNEFKDSIKHLPSIAFHTIPSWTAGKIDFIVTHALATKQHSISEIAKLLHLSTDEIIGIGDGSNDLPLLQACGLKVAMGNAAPELKEIADYIAPSVEEDGVADVIEKFVLEV